MNEALDLAELSHRIMLYNSLVALIVLPVEEAKRQGTKRKKNPLYTKTLSDLQKDCSFSLELFEPIDHFDKDRGCLLFSNRTIYSFMRKLRNAIAHQNVRFDSKGGISRISFFNVYRPRGLSQEMLSSQLSQRKLKLVKHSIEDFRISVSFEELRDLSTWIGSEYLRALNYVPK